MTYQIVYSKPNSSGLPLTTVARIKDEALEKARQLESVGYTVSVWERSDSGSSQVYGTASDTTTVKEIAAAAGMSCRKLAERFGIPYRTMEDWSSSKRTPPDYVLAMMREILGI